MDPLLLDAVVDELKKRMPHGARIDKVHQPSTDMLILRLWSGREELRLLLSTEVGRPRLHLTVGAPPNPGVPPRFCQLLRARLTRIEEVQSAGDDRIVRFVCRGRGGEGYVLVAELFGTTPNLLLLDSQEEIVDVLHRPHRPAPSHFRTSLAIDPPPDVPPDARDPLPFEKWLLKTFHPMSRTVARDLAAAVAAGHSPQEALSRFRRRWIAREYRPFVGEDSGKTIISPYWMTDLRVEVIREFPSPSDAADFYYGVGAGSARKNDLEKAIRKSLQKLRGRQEKIAGDAQSLGEKIDGRRYGELLLANLHQIRQGEKEITVDDWYADPPVPLSIPLDPRLSPQENAEKYFRTYKKGKKGEEHIARRLRETEDEIAWLEEAEQALAEAVTSEELEALRRELEEGGIRLNVPLSVPRKGSPDIRKLLRRGITPSGFEVVWGKNSRTNDFVSRELAAPDDFWFHAHRLPGCHLVLRRGGKVVVPEDDLLFAASLAAGYSRGQNDAKVEVMVTEGKWVRKPKGARPGLVTVEKFRTVVVRPRRWEEQEGGA